MKRILTVAAGVLLAVSCVRAEEIVIEMHLVDANGVGKSIGTITASANKHGVLLTPNLSELPPGPHGFHVHQNPSCEPGEKEGKKVPALAAGGHLDPAAAKAHDGPYANGHLGDLPALWVDAEGKATQPLLAPRLKMGDLKGHALMIHAGGDNYSDKPADLGGGGARMVCGVAK
jgi:Cu-Zn family superoxide dismutase